MTVPRVVLRTKRLTLEPVAAHHADGLFGAVIESRLELLPWMPWARDPSFEGNRRSAEDGERAWSEDRRFHFVMVERATLSSDWRRRAGSRRRRSRRTALLDSLGPLEPRADY